MFNRLFRSYGWLLLIAPMASCFGICTNPPPLPMEATCSTGVTTGITKLEIGGVKNFMDESEAFMPLHDGDPPDIIEGGQGLTMLLLRLRLTGPAVPSCIAGQITELDPRLPGPALNSNSFSTFPQPDGTSTTKTILTFPEFGATTLYLNASVGTVQQSIRLGPAVDLGSDGGEEDMAGAGDLAAPDLGDSDQ